MRAAFPTHFKAAFLGKSREAGSFQRDAETKIEYGDACLLEFENSEGLSQTVQVAVQALDEAAGAGLDVLKMPKYTQLDVTGDVFVNDTRTSFRPSKVTKSA